MSLNATLHDSIAGFCGGMALKTEAGRLLEFGIWSAEWGVSREEGRWMRDERKGLWPLEV